MKKLVIAGFIAGIILSGAHEAKAYTQDITLSPGWNVVSTPKILDGHAFSVPETSENFDIFSLDASKPSGWATMADLGHTTFTPLFGYFINNKTEENQTLTFTYKEDVCPGECFFERTFSTDGWYSIGIANHTYSKNIYYTGSDTNNQSSILSLVDGNYDSVVDFTDAVYSTNRNSVALSSPWKLAVSADIASLNDFRDTKGYAIYIKNAGAKYLGYQDDSDPPSAPDPASLAVSINSSSPGISEVIASEGSNEDELDGLELLRFDIAVEGDDVELASITASISHSGSTATTSTAYLYNGSTLIGSTTVSGSTAVFSSLNHAISAGTTRTLILKVDVQDATLDATVFSASVASGAAIAAVNSLDSSLSDDVKTGSASGSEISVRSAGPELSLTSKSITKTSNDTNSTAQGTFNIRVTAVGGDVVASTTGAFDFEVFENGTASSTIGVLEGIYSAPSGTTVSGDNITIAEGNTVTFAVDVLTSLTTSDNTTKLYAFQVQNISMNNASFDFMDGNVEWRTSTVTLP